MNLWNNNDIEVVEIEGRYYALNGWNGEYYADCWETDSSTFNLNTGVVYEIRPLYEVDGEDFNLIGYEII